MYKLRCSSCRSPWLSALVFSLPLQWSPLSPTGAKRNRHSLSPFRLPSLGTNGSKPTTLKSPRNANSFPYPPRAATSRAVGSRVVKNNTDIFPDESFALAAFDSDWSPTNPCPKYHQLPSVSSSSEYPALLPPLPAGRAN